MIINAQYVMTELLERERLSNAIIHSIPLLNARHDPTRDNSIPVAISRLVNCEKYITFLWKQIRRKTQNGTYKKVGIDVYTLAGRTEITFVLGSDSYVSYAGASDAYSARIQDCKIDHETVTDFEKFLTEFVDNFDSTHFVDLD